MITGRIIYSNHAVKKYRAGYAALTHWGVVETIVQSAAIYSAALISLLATYVSGSNAQYVCLDALQPIIVRTTLSSPSASGRVRKLVLALTSPSSGTRRNLICVLCPTGDRLYANHHPRRTERSHGRVVAHTLARPVPHGSCGRSGPAIPCSCRDKRVGVAHARPTELRGVPSQGVARPRERAGRVTVVSRTPGALTQRWWMLPRGKNRSMYGLVSWRSVLKLLCMCSIGQELCCPVDVFVAHLRVGAFSYSLILTGKRMVCAESASFRVIS